MISKSTKRCQRLSVLALVLSILLAYIHLQGQGQPVRIAAAADLKFAMQEIAAQFEKQTGTNVEVTYGSSGNFFSQIQSGAPFDLFFSADIDFPRKLEAAGASEPGTLYEYAVGRLVIWTPADTNVDVAKDGWKALLDNTVQKIAIANPAHAPYGRAAVTAMQKAGVYEQLKSKLVFGENISQAAQFVQSGNAQAGLIAKSLALSPSMRDGTQWEIPAEMYPPIEQGAILLKTAKNKSGALQLLEFVKSKGGCEILEKYGFVIPSNAFPPRANK